MTWSAFIAEIEARSGDHLPADMRAAVRAVLPLGDSGVTLLMSCGTGRQLERGEGDDHRLGAVASAPDLDATIDIFGPAGDSALVTLGAILDGTHPLPLRSQVVRGRATIRSWRPCRRAQIQLVIAGSSDSYFVKLERPAKALRWERLRQVLALELAESQAIAIAEPAGADPDYGLSIAKQVSGTPLAELLAGIHAGTVLHQLGRALRDLEPLAAQPSVAALLPRLDFTAAAADLGRFIRLLGRFAMPGAALLAAGADRLAALGEVDSGRRALIHRDLHDGQVVITGNRFTLLDLEGASIGDPALDVGNLLAHLHLRQLQGRLANSATSLESAFLAGYGARPGGEWLRAVRAYEALSLFRLAAVYDLRPRWRPLGWELTGAGHAVLDEIESRSVYDGAIA